MKQVILTLLLLAPYAINADSSHDHSNHSHQALAIPQDIRLLLRQEMNHLRQGMESLVFLIASAQWQEIEKLGTSIEKTFIMKKTLTKEQMQRLHGSLPDSFKQLDKTFHSYAGKLSQAARSRDMELVQYYRYRMNQSCSACHSAFAYERFSGYQ